jgi:hypothetical protein
MRGGGKDGEVDGEGGRLQIRALLGSKSGLFRGEGTHPSSWF